MLLMLDGQAADWHQNSNRNIGRPARQAEQLATAGFSRDVRVFNLAGQPADRGCRDITLGFVAHKVPS
jgi:hypothetical protein